MALPVADGAAKKIFYRYLFKINAERKNDGVDK